MLIRSTVEKVLPLREGERRLKPAERSFAMHDFYFLRGEAVGFSCESNAGPFTRRTYPYKHIVTFRNRRGVTSFSGGSRQQVEPGYETARSLAESEATARLNRVLKVARGVKVTLAATLAGAAGWALVDAVQASAAAEQTQINQVTACSSAVDGQEALVPLNVPVDQAQQLGETVCKIGTHLYGFNPTTGSVLP